MKIKISDFISKRDAIRLSPLPIVFAFISQASAQGEQEGLGELEEVSVIGSRRVTGSSKDIPSPVEVIPIADLQSQGGTDMSDMIRTAVPSFNVTAHPISGTSSLVRPPNLRGLGADHTLVLVNGKRRHRAANIPNFSGGINDGTQGADISNIPSIALKSVDVLRDGASAQYGADAIAGVINFVANDDPETRSIELKAGQHYEGDGDSINIAGTFGFAIGNGGSLNLSAEYTDTDRTDRAQQTEGNQAFTDAGYSGVPNPAIPWGSPEVRDDIKLFANLATPISSSTELYGYLSYAERENISGFFYRNPVRNGVFAIGDERIVFDTTPGGNIGEGSGNCPALTVPDLNDPAVVAADLSAIEALRNNPNCYSFLEDFPGGVTPWFRGKNQDSAFSLGLRGEFSPELSYDLSYTWGENEVGYSTFNNFNPTFGPDSPTDLYAGDRIQTEQTLNGQLVFPMQAGFASPLNIALGLEWHEEAYEQVPGQREAWDVGPYTRTAQGTAGISVGTLGFGSFNPTTSFSATRDNAAVYVDVETDVLDNWTVGAAVRHEEFSDLGGDTNFKLASLFKFSEGFGLRFTMSTGFHAPTPGQQQFAQSTVGFDANGVLSTTSTLPVDVVAQLPNWSDRAAPLKAETSESVGLGFVFDYDVLDLTVDFFQIDVKDRITLTSTEAIGDEDRQALFAAGFTNAESFTAFNFFTNDFDTQTTGVDIVGSVPLHNSGYPLMKLGLNYTETEVTRQGANLSDLRLAQLEEQLPELKGNLSFIHAMDKLTGIVRVNYYGSLTEYYLSLDRKTDIESMFTLDLELTYNALDTLGLSVGAQNLLDEYPTEAVYADTFGSTYPVSSPAGFGGGYYYAKIKYTFD